MRGVKPKIIIIVGPNASGKSELAVKLAKKFNGEIISADSRQVYRELDIGTGKIEGKWKVTKNKKLFIYKDVPHHCLDFVSPKKQYSVAEFKKCANTAIKNISVRKKVPILAGGTGFWIDAVVYNFNLPNVLPDKSLRNQLAKKTPSELFKILKKLDPERARTIEQKNPRRLVRAIEIAKKLGQVPKLKKYSPYKTLWLGIKSKPEELKNRIHKRLLTRLQKGMLGEAKRLRQNGLTWKRFYELGLEYRFLAACLHGILNKKEMMILLEKAIVDYARRQMVWFKKNPSVCWITNKKAAERLGEKFLK